MDKQTHPEDPDLELYGDPGIASKNAKIPTWLICSNWFWVIVGFVGLFLYWNGSYGWLDRGYWSQLQRAANTAYPYTTMEIVEREAAEKREAATNKHEKL
jgi:hypothetical protein